MHLIGRKQRTKYSYDPKKKASKKYRENFEACICSHVYKPTHTHI